MQAGIDLQQNKAKLHLSLPKYSIMTECHSRGSTELRNFMAGQDNDRGYSAAPEPLQ